MDITADKKSRKLNIMPLEKRLMFDASLPVIAGQVLWLDANDATTILDAEGDNAASGGAFSGQATTWRDKSGSNFHVTATVNQTPVYTANALNGNSVLTFDGINDKMTRATASIPGDDFTMFVVFNKTQTANRDAVFEIGNGSSRNAIFVNDTSAPTRINYYINSSFINFTSTYTAGAYTMTSVIHNTNSVNLFRNAASEVSTTGATRLATNGIYVGDDSSGSDNLQGNIAEILVYDRDLSADERHDIENYLANKWGLTATNAAPTVSANTGVTIDQGASTVITTTMLSATDTDNTDSLLRYTITNAVDYGTLTNTNTGLALGLGDSFTQGDLAAGYITYAHNNSINFSESFDFTVHDGLATTSAASFSITLTPTNTAPIIDGWTLVSHEDFESGVASGWASNTVENGGTWLTRHLGRFSNNGAGQTNFKTYTLGGGQEYTVIEFDFYRLDSWDTEAFRIYVDDALIFNQNFTTAPVSIPDGSSGSVSWSVTETTTTSTHFAYGTWTDQKMRFTLTIQNSAAGNVKLGFGSGVQQGIADESWGIDNVRVYEVDGGNVPGPYTIAENSANGQTVGRVTARDAESNTITYSITGGTGAAAFSINASTGLITVANAALLNFEVTPSFTLQVTATDNGSPNLSDVETITINLIDVPENTAPTFPAAGPFSVAENAANNTVVGSVSATDPDGNTITYTITGGNTDNIFAINASTGAIRIANNANLNYEWDNQYTLTITATDNGFGALATNRNVVINITDVNEAPTFDAVQAILSTNPYLRYDTGTGNFYQYVGTTSTYAAATAAAGAQAIHGVAGHLVTITSLAENNYVRALGSGSIWLGATDVGIEGDWIWGAGGAEGGQMFWQGTAAGSTQNGLYARWNAGEPSNSGNADYAIMLASGMWDDVTGGSYAYVIEWEGSAVLAASAALQNGPYTVNENSAAGTAVGAAEAFDIDGNALTYSITGGTGAGLFSINATTGAITVTASNTLNYEAATSYTIDVRAQDAGSLFGTRTITINIADVNETPVIGALGAVNIAENTANNTLLATASASDPDGNAITYSIAAGNTDNIFSINGTNGQIRVTNAANMSFEHDTQYVLTIRATDNGTGSLFSQTTLTINITDVNEAPTFDSIQALLLSDPLLRYDSGTGNFYKYYGTTQTYAVASANAAAQTLFGVSGHIATVTSLAENTFIRNMGTGTLWLAGRDNIIEGDWYWDGGGAESGVMFWQGTSTGSVQNGLFARWGGGEPNNSGNEDHLTMRADGFWNDINGGSHAYVVEWEGASVLAAAAALQNGPYTVNENVAAGTVVGSAEAFDIDAGDTISYSITGGTGASLFSINSATGAVTVTASDTLNFEATYSYTLDLRVQDVGGLFSTRTVTININDINDLPTNMILSGNAIVENDPIGTFIGNLSAFDEDGDTLTYTLVNDSSGHFRLVGTTIESNRAIDYEQFTNHTLTIRMNDGNGGIVDQNFVINVTNLADDAVVPPSSNNFDPGTQNFAFEEPEEFEKGDILASALQGDGGLEGAYYGMGAFMQILRENTVFEIRDILESGTGRPGDIVTDLPQFVSELYRLDNDEEQIDGSIPDREPHFTNLREVLAFLEQLDKDKAEEGTDKKDGEAHSRALPRTPLDAQFEDVMTYHEKRRAALREALLS